MEDLLGNLIWDPHFTNKEMEAQRDKATHTQLLACAEAETVLLLVCSGFLSFYPWDLRTQRNHSKDFLESLLFWFILKKIIKHWLSTEEEDRLVLYWLHDWPVIEKVERSHTSITHWPWIKHYAGPWRSKVMWSNHLDSS